MAPIFAQMLRDVGARGGAVGAFTAYNFETGQAVIAAAARRSTPVIVLVGAKSLRTSRGPDLVRALVDLATRAAVPATVQLDHTDDLALAEQALELGVGAVMADGSTMPFGENIAFVKAVADAARECGAAVEAELGGITGDEDVAAAVAAGALTDPDEAAAFVAATGAACFAVSIGNAHGRYARPPRLDWERLALLRRRLPVPLSLHGASGLAPSTLRRAIQEGIAKINVNTELRERYLRTIEEQLPMVIPNSRMLELGLAVAEALEAATDEKLALYADDRTDR